METKIVIASNPKFAKPIPNEPYLEIAELFFGTVQGEGVNTGVPAVFLRMQHCTLNCHWCDTASVWRRGNPYTITEVLNLFQSSGIVDALRDGAHLILTGGSPLAQQQELTWLMQNFYPEFGFVPYIEVENECTLMPTTEFSIMVDCWNNSPKLSNSGNSKIVRYKPEVLQSLSNKENAWFKFVVRSEDEWKEIEEMFIKPGYIHKSKVILMPVGGSRKELEANREAVVEMAVRHNVRYSDRLHVELWDLMTGV